jgi:hypothetical protein
MPTFAMPIFRASSRTATTFLKSAAAAPLTTTLGSFCDAFSVCSLNGSCAIVILSLLKKISPFSETVIVTALASSSIFDAELADGSGTCIP